MERTKKSLFQRAVSLMLAAALVFSTMVVGTRQTVSAAEMSLKPNGGTITISDETCSAVTKELTWVKYKAKADGYLQLKFSGNSQVVSYPYGQVQLYNQSRNKYLSGLLEYDTGSTAATNTSEYYGVKKGTTYYIGVSSYGGVNISVKFKKVNDKSGSKKSKALNLNRKKTTVGVIGAGTTASHWFKFKTTKTQKITFNITPYLTGPVRLTLSGPGVYTRSFDITTGYWGKKDPISSTGKVRAGTYYVQIKPAAKTCTGYYKVSWK